MKVMWTAGVVGWASGGGRGYRRRRRGQRYKHQHVAAAEPCHDPRLAWADVRLRQFGRGRAGES
jgi:ribosomal protein S11